MLDDAVELQREIGEGRQVEMDLAIVAAEIADAGADAAAELAGRRAW